MRLLALLAMAGAVSAYGVTAHAQAAATTSEGGYEVRKWQTVARAPHGSVGRKTTDHETRVGNTPETDGNSSNFVMTIGGFAKKCPTAEGIVAGEFEYSLTVDEVNTDEGETQRTHYAKRIVAGLEGQVRDDATIDFIDVNAEFTRGDGTPPQRVRTRFTPGRAGEPDMAAMRSAVEMTADLSIAIVMWMAAPIYREALLEWTKMNECVEFSFDPPSEERSLGPNESAEIRTELKTKDGKFPVGGAKMQANALQGIGNLAPHQGETRVDAPFTFAYTASPNPRPGHGFDVATFSRAGAAGAKWKIGDGLVKFTIEHRIWDDPGTPGALVGNALFDGTVRFDVTLAPFPRGPGEFLGKAAVVRQMRVGHVTPRCRGSASQSEDWNIIATVDAATRSLRLDASMYSRGDGVGTWTCVPGGPDDLVVDMASELQPLVVPATIGTPQNFVVNRPDGNHETITITVLASPVTR